MPTLEAKVEALLQETHRLTVATKTRIRIFLAVMLLIVVALAAFGVTAFQARAAASQARKALVASCESGNDFRRLDLSRWLYILDLSAKSPPPRGETLQEAKVREKRTRQFRQFIVAADKLRICKKL